MNDEKESTIIATTIEDMLMTGIPIPPQSPQIVNPVQANSPINPQAMIDNVAGIFIWQGELKLIASPHMMVYACVKPWFRAT